MNLEQYLLNKLAEECSEVTKEALKASYYGLGSDYQGTNNRERLQRELDDVALMQSLLRYYDLWTRLSHHPDVSQFSTNTERLAKFAHYLWMSHHLGNLQLQQTDYEFLSRMGLPKGAMFLE